MLFSDRIRVLFPGYILDQAYRVRAGRHTPTLNFNQMKELFLSKDLERNRELDWISRESDRFLDGTVNMLQNSVAFCSYPRSGNTMLRTFLESITGITTGSNFPFDLVAVTLQIVGLKGEEITSEDNTVWINKTHCLPWPIQNLSFRASKQFCLFRNPIDIMPSLLNL